MYQTDTNTGKIYLDLYLLCEIYVLRPERQHTVRVLILGQANFSGNR